MKAIRYHAYGQPPRLEDVEAPVVGADEVLVRVAAAALNPLDVKLHSGRMQWFFKLGFPYTMGSDLVGMVEQVGGEVVDRRPGDVVIGRRAPVLGGAFAELAAVPARACVKLPPSLSSSAGAGIPTAAGTAWSSLFDIGNLTVGQSVLIHAGAGGVGSFAVQFAKAAGARVFATASSDTLDLVRSLGADEVIDHRERDFSQVFQSLDLVLDTIGSETQDRSFGILRPGGHLVSIVSQPSEEKALASGLRVSRVYFEPREGDLQRVVDHIVDHHHRVLIDSERSLAEFSSAFERQASGRARGKIIMKTAA